MKWWRAVRLAVRAAQAYQSHKEEEELQTPHKARFVEQLDPQINELFDYLISRFRDLGDFEVEKTKRPVLRLGDEERVLTGRDLEISFRKMNSGIEFAHQRSGIWIRRSGSPKDQKPGPFLIQLPVQPAWLFREQSLLKDPCDFLFRFIALLCLELSSSSAFSSTYKFPEFRDQLQNELSKHGNFQNPYENQALKEEYEICQWQFEMGMREPSIVRLAIAHDGVRERFHEELNEVNVDPYRSVQGKEDFQDWVNYVQFPYRKMTAFYYNRIDMRLGGHLHWISLPRKYWLDLEESLPGVGLISIDEICGFASLCLQSLIQKEQEYPTISSSL